MLRIKCAFVYDVTRQLSFVRNCVDTHHAIAPPWQLPAASESCLSKPSVPGSNTHRPVPSTH